MFPKCSPDVPKIAMLREHSANIPGILRAGWKGSRNELFYYQPSVVFWKSILKIFSTVYNFFNNSFYRYFRFRKQRKIKK